MPAFRQIKNLQDSRIAAIWGYTMEKPAAAIKRRKELKKSEDILDNDNMGSEKLGANLFRITQAEAKLWRENIQSKEEANKAHFEVGYTVRKAIESLGGTMPEDLPAPDKSIKQIEHERKNQLKKK